MEKIIEITRHKLQELAGEGYRKFNASLIPTVPAERILGVRIPCMRKLAAEIAKTDWRSFLKAYNMEEGNPQPERYMEEILLQGLVIARAKMEIGERLRYIRGFVPKIDNWAVCDVFCSSGKWAGQNREIVWNFLQPYLQSQKEFEVRYGVIMLLGNYLNEEYISRVLEALDGIEAARHENRKIPAEQLKKRMPSVENYYVEMAVAWCLATAFAKCREQTLAYLKGSCLSASVLKKTVRKICESYRVSAADKELVKSFLGPDRLSVFSHRRI